MLAGQYYSVYCLGGYTFNHEDMEVDSASVVSSKSEKEAAEYYERELKVKLMDNYVGADNKDETKKTNSLKRFTKTNSLKRIFSKKGK